MHNYQQLNLKQKQKQTKQTTRTGTESQKWRSRGGLSAEEGEGEEGGTCIGNKQHKWQVENRQREVKNSVGNVEAKELICMTPGREPKEGNVGGKECAERRGRKGGNGTTIIA